MSEGKVKRYELDMLCSQDPPTYEIQDWEPTLVEKEHGQWVEYETWMDDRDAFIEAHRALREAANQASIAITNLEFGGTSGFKFAKDIDDALLLCDAAEGEKP